MAEINNEYSNSEIINYQVSGAEKKLYHSSKEPKEGYRKIEMKEGGFTYHRYLDGLIGKISYLSFKETPFGKRFGILLKDDITGSISIPLDTEGYRVFIEALYNVDFSKEVAIKFYPKTAVTQKGQKKTYQNCFLYYTKEEFVDPKDGKKKNVCPERLDSKLAPQGKLRASGKWDFSAQEEWYYEKASELASRFEKFKAEKSIESKPKETPKVGVDIEDSSELPY